MNILAATADDEAKDEVYNVALGDRTTLNELYFSLQNALNDLGVQHCSVPTYRDFRAGDVRHSQANITKAQDKLGYAPAYRIQNGINKAMPWYKKFIG